MLLSSVRGHGLQLKNEKHQLCLQCGESDEIEIILETHRGTMEDMSYLVCICKLCVDRAYHVRGVSFLKCAGFIVYRYNALCRCVQFFRKTTTAAERPPTSSFYDMSRTSIRVYLVYW